METAIGAKVHETKATEDVADSPNVQGCGDSSPEEGTKMDADEKHVAEITEPGMEIAADHERLMALCRDKGQDTKAIFDVIGSDQKMVSLWYLLDHFHANYPQDMVLEHLCLGHRDHHTRLSMLARNLLFLGVIFQFADDRRGLALHRRLMRDYSQLDITKYLHLSPPVRVC
jgi:hypothetical protein